MNTNQSQAPFGVPETGDQKKPGKGLLIACISGFAVLGVIIGLFFGHSMGAANSAKSSSPVLHPKADAGESKRDQAGKYIWLTSSLAHTQLQIWEHPLKMLWMSTEKLCKVRLEEISLI